MIRWLSILFLAASFGASALEPAAHESVVHDDGTGAQISFCLATHGKWKEKDVEYTHFNISVAKGGKLLLLTRLSGQVTDDGQYFRGKIVIPSEFVALAEITLLGGVPNSSMGASEKVKVSDFKKIARKKSWTEQE